MALVKPITAVRVLTLVITILLAAVLFLQNGTFWMDFLVGAAAGLSIGVQVIIWNSQLGSRDEAGEADVESLRQSGALPRQ